MFHQEQLPSYAKKVTSSNPAATNHMPSMIRDQSASKLTVQ
jgi:hypothetical protein